MLTYRYIVNPNIGIVVTNAPVRLPVELCRKLTLPPYLRSWKTIPGVLDIIHAKIPAIDDNLLAEDTSMKT